MCLVAIVSLVMIFYYAPKLGQKNVLIYIIICSVVGSLSVMGCKGIGLAIVQTFQGLSNYYYKYNVCRSKLTIPMQVEI